jgi:molecular chaperone GrpE
VNNDKAKNNKHQEEPVKEEKNSEPVPEKAASLEEACGIFRDKYMRACADFANARKRWDREKEDLIKFSNSSLLRDLLIVLDESEQALKMVKEHGNIEEIIKGLEMAHNNFLNILKKQGLEPMECVGKNFDPHLHEVIASKDVNENIDKPVVLEEIQRGYLLEDKVLRPARVIVGIGKKPETREQELKENKQQPKIENEQ